MVNSLFIQIMWVSLLDRSLGWETSNGGEEGAGGEEDGYLIL